MREIMERRWCHTNMNCGHCIHVTTCEHSWEDDYDCEEFEFARFEFHEVAEDS